MKPNYKESAMQMQFAAQQHTLHLTTIQTLNAVLETTLKDESLGELKRLTAKALLEHIKPFTKNPIETTTDEIIG